MNDDNLIPCQIWLEKKICGLYCSRQALIYVPKVTSAKSLGVYIRRIIKFLAVSSKAHQSQKQKDTRIKKETKQNNNNNNDNNKKETETMDASSIFLGAPI